MDPQIRSGWPVVSGTRIPTPIVYGMHLGGESVADLAREYEIPARKVQRVIEFEQALWGAISVAHAPAAG